MKKSLLRNFRHFGVKEKICFQRKRAGQIPRIKNQNSLKFQQKQCLQNSERNFQPKILDPNKLLIKPKGKMKTFLFVQGLTNFTSHMVFLKKP